MDILHIEVIGSNCVRDTVRCECLWLFSGKTAHFFRVDFERVVAEFSFGDGLGVDLVVTGGKL